MLTGDRMTEIVLDVVRGVPKPDLSPDESKFWDDIVTESSELPPGSMFYVPGECEVDLNDVEKGVPSHVLKGIIKENSRTVYQSLYKWAGPSISDVFNQQEREAIDRVLEKIPPHLLDQVRRIEPSSLGDRHGLYDPDTRTVRLSTHAFTDPARFGPSGVIPHSDLTIAHEIGHSVYDHILRSQERDEWRRLSGWRTQLTPSRGQAAPYVERRPGWPEHVARETHSVDAQFVTPYGEKNSGEDFADVFAFAVNDQWAAIPKEKREFMRGVLVDGKVDKLIAKALRLIVKGGAGSGNYGHSGRPGVGPGGSAPGGGAERRTARGKHRTRSQTPSTFADPETGRLLAPSERGTPFEALMKAKVEDDVAKYFGVTQELKHISGPEGVQNAPFDFTGGRWAIEVKSITTENQSQKTSIKKEELDRKSKFAKENNKAQGLIVQRVNQATRTVEVFGAKGMHSWHVHKYDRIATYRYSIKDLRKAGMVKKARNEDDDERVGPPQEGDLVIEFIDGVPHQWIAGPGGKRPPPEKKKSMR